MQKEQAGCLARWGGPGRSRQAPGRCSQHWDFRGSRWIPAVQPSCLGKASTALLGNTHSLPSQNVCGCFYKRGEKQKRDHDDAVFLRAQTEFIAAQRCVNGISRHRMTMAVVGLVPSVGLFCYSFVKYTHTHTAVPSNPDGFDKCRAEGGIAAYPENNAEGSLPKGNRCILSLQVAQPPCKTTRLY